MTKNIFFYLTLLLAKHFLSKFWFYSLLHEFYSASIFEIYAKVASNLLPTHRRSTHGKHFDDLFLFQNWNSGQTYFADYAMKQKDKIRRNRSKKNFHMIIHWRYIGIVTKKIIINNICMQSVNQQHKYIYSYNIMYIYIYIYQCIQLFTNI